MACSFVPQIAIYGANETPIYGNDEIPTYGELPPCTETLRDKFAIGALCALGSDQTYNFSRSDLAFSNSVRDAYILADLMLSQREE